MTERLYYTDPFVRSFDATVVRAEHQSGTAGTARTRDGRTIVTLDRSAFYPTSGGQPFDVGTLAGHQVVDVVDNEDDGSVGHVIEGDAPLTVGQSVHGEIDWPRRFDHMQQHSGQHVLSAAFVRLFDVRTVSFHLSADASTIDLAREVTAGEIAAAERAANDVVWEDRPVHVSFVSKEEALKLPLRKESAREGTLRLIDIDRWDLSACGGTHVPRTGIIGVIAIASWERFKGGQRVEFLCGARALRRFGAMRDVVTAGSRLLSVLPHEVPPAIERLLAEAKDQRRASTQLKSELARYQAEDLVSSAEPSASGHLVLRAIDADANTLKALASAVTAKPGLVAVLISTSKPALAVVARSADVSVSAQQVLAGLVAKFGGRGGGKPELAQGGGLDGEPADILADAKARVGGHS